MDLHWVVKCRNYTIFCSLFIFFATKIWTICIVFSFPLNQHYEHQDLHIKRLTLIFILYKKKSESFATQNQLDFFLDFDSGHSKTGFHCTSSSSGFMDLSICRFYLERKRQISETGLFAGLLYSKANAAWEAEHPCTTLCTIGWHTKYLQLSAFLEEVSVICTSSCMFKVFYPAARWTVWGQLCRPQTVSLLLLFCY